AECNGLNSGEVFDGGIADNCRPSSCPNPAHVLDGENCRLPQTDAECNGLNSGEVFDGGIADNCRPSSCTNPAHILDGENCRLPQNDAECERITADEIFDGAEADNCRAKTATDCDAGEFLDNTGDCRAPMGSDCSAQNEVPVVSGGVLSCDACPTGMVENTAAELMCRAETSTDCASGQLFRNGCRAAEGSDCPMQNEIPSVSGGVLSCDACPTGMVENTAAELMCRAETSSDCDATEVFVGGVCRLPLTTAECGTLTSGEVFDIAEADNCRATSRIDTCLADGTGALQSRAFTPIAAGTVIPGNSDPLTGPTIDRTLDNDTLFEFLDKVGGGAADGFNFVAAHRFYLRNPNSNNWGQSFVANSPTNLASQPGVDRVYQPDFEAGGGSRYLRAGDVFAVHSGAIVGAGGSETYNAAKVIGIFQVYVDNRGASPTLRVATGARTTERIGGTSLSADVEEKCVADAGDNEFFLGADWELLPTVVGSRARGDFGSFRDTREILLGGVLNKNNSAVRANNFSFAADSALKNMHIEYTLPETKTGDISWRNYSGYRMQNGGKTQIYYQKAAAEYAPAGKNWRLYALSTSGRINSEIYENTPLASFSTGFFAGKIFRHDDEYHVRLNTPFSAAEVREWELSADARLGLPESHVRLGLHKNLATKKSSARIFYRREF
ncbi:MAG: hypothetical protein HAW59_05035, partial [Betaproteobacteria bacterium]|nr:hypothetical protein [Betaproteobacteria bacterium]